MPRIFISYSHETKEHDSWVEELAAELRRNGVDATLDTWDMTPGLDMTVFMESQIRDSDFVVLVCTPTYAQKSNIPHGGVGYEKNIISAELLQASDLRPKFLPVLRLGDFTNALPTYLGSKYAIDFRDEGKATKALSELLRAIFGEPHPHKPPLGPNPLAEGQSNTARLEDRPSELHGLPDIELWEHESLGRFEHLQERRIHDQKVSPFAKGYWQASFVLLSELRSVRLPEFLKKLKEAETNRTGWDIGWVPTREAIAPYPYKGGIEVWLAENDRKESGHADFWRAEPSGRFSLFRGYQEDENGFPRAEGTEVLDFRLVLWRISEFLLYIESFARRMEATDSGAKVRLYWCGLDGRTLTDHTSTKSYTQYQCLQDSVTAEYAVAKASLIKQDLIQGAREITAPLFESFNFFSLTERQVQACIKELFDPDKELRRA